jgi:hypothetical protein
MVVAVLADIVEIIVLATSADALSKKLAGAPEHNAELYVVHLLCVDGTRDLGQRLSLANCAEEDGLELVHARVREEQGGVIVRDDRGRWHCGAERSAKSR